MADPSPRYAVFFAPAAGSAHDVLGSSWIGRNARSGKALAQPRIHGIEPARFAALTAAPRRYGLHATLKPPFRLRDGADLALLDAQLRTLASTQQRFSFRVEAAPLDGFLAWRASERHEQLAALAAHCVTDLDDLRRPPSAAELARRRAPGLSARQDKLLLRWGYPYVFEEYRFHITLSNRLAGDEAMVLGDALAQSSNALTAHPLVADALALFAQDTDGADFRHLRSYRFDGSVCATEDTQA